MTRKTVKQMLIDLYTEEREQERCVIVHDLRQEAAKVRKPYEDEISIMENERSELEHKKSILYNKVNSLKKKSDDTLKTAKLFHFGEHVCGNALHGDLMDFDKATKAHIRGILNGAKD